MHRKSSKKGLRKYQRKASIATASNDGGGRKSTTERIGIIENLARAPELPLLEAPAAFARTGLRGNPSIYRVSPFNPKVRILDVPAPFSIILLLW